MILAAKLYYETPNGLGNRHMNHTSLLQGDSKIVF